VDVSIGSFLLMCILPHESIWQRNCSRRCVRKIPEAELIAISKQGHQDAIAELFRRHYPSSLRLAAGILRQPDDAQDAVQAAYFLAFRRLEQFRGEASFRTWISRIVLNCCLRQLREAGGRVTWVHPEDRNGAQGSDLLVSRTPNPEKSAWGAEIALALSKAIARLPKHLREAYLLFAVSGLSLREVATALGLTVAATKTRLFRARAGLRSLLQPVWHGRR
jgi:RNA polymerase sigma-70 factor (ECF subfamily)